MWDDDDLLGRIDTQALYQPFLERVNTLLNKILDEQGVKYYGICGYRSWERQEQLYAIGRTTGKLGHYVTKAKPGQSLHQFAAAIDFCRDTNVDKPGLQPDWSDASNKLLAEVATGLGLEAGYYWKFQDTPHVQLPIRKHGLTLAMLQGAYKSGGMPAVFKLLDAHGPW